MFCVAIALLSLLIFNWTGEADLRQFDMKRRTHNFKNPECVFLFNYHH